LSIAALTENPRPVGFGLQAGFSDRMNTGPCAGGAAVLPKHPTSPNIPQETTMAMSPTAAPAPSMLDDTDAGDEDVLLTVCKEADGTYSLVKGDEQDADGADTAGSAAPADKQTFDSKGSLLKAILDILNEDEESAGGEGSSGDQFQAGFDENAPPKPASLAQKF
jgi:hypothetical protein